MGIGYPGALHCAQSNPRGKKFLDEMWHHHCIGIDTGNAIEIPAPIELKSYTCYALRIVLEHDQVGACNTGTEQPTPLLGFSKVVGPVPAPTNATPLGSPLELL